MSKKRTGLLISAAALLGVAALGFATSGFQNWNKDDMKDKFVPDVQAKALINSTELTYDALVELRDSKDLVPGTYYRITDYKTTTIQEGSRSAGDPFDVIVLALDEGTLSENAHALQSKRDTAGYFADSDLASWKLKYSLDNDTNRFAWADSANGKGVIYRLIDEFNNDVPYDFKNIQFKRDLFYDKYYDITFTDIYFYTFSAYSWDLATGLQSDIEDATIITKKEGIDDFFNSCHTNVIKPLFSTQYVGTVEVPTWELNSNIFINGYMLDDTYFSCYGNTFGNDVYNNTFGNDVYNNTFGNGVYNNTFGKNVSSNTFGNDVYNNTFGNGVYNNTFGNNVSSNTFGNNVSNNTFGNNVSSNTFGNNVSNNTFGNNVYNNTFGNDVIFNTFGNGINYIELVGGDSNAKAQFITIESGIKGRYDAKLNLSDSGLFGNAYPVTIKQAADESILMLWQIDATTIGGKYKTSPTGEWLEIK